MRNYFILCLFSFVSCSELDSKFEIQNSFSLNNESDICISTEDCFSCISDSNLFYKIMHYSYGGSEEKKQIVDTVEFTPYFSTLHSFKSQKNNSYVVLWKIESEFIPIFNAYYIKDGVLMKLGEFKVYLPCESCDVFDYSIENIQIRQRNKEIEFLFLKDLYYMDRNIDAWTLYKARALMLHFNIK